MPPLPTRKDHPAKQLLHRVNHVAGQLNVFLLVIALGLGALDLSVLWMLKVEQSLPPITRVDCPWTGNAPSSTAPGTTAPATAPVP